MAYTSVLTRIWNLFAMELLQHMGTDKRVARFLPSLYEDSGRELGSAHLPLFGVF
jgi:hypothetical protein